MRPHSERPTYLPTPANPRPPATPLNPATQAAIQPTPQINRGVNLGPIGVLRRPPARPAPVSQPILTAGGANPVDVVNAVNPQGGITSSANFDLGPPSLVDDTAAVPDASSSDGGSSFTQFAFLAGAVFVAWLALKGS